MSLPVVTRENVFAVLVELGENPTARRVEAVFAGVRTTGRVLDMTRGMSVYQMVEHFRAREPEMAALGALRGQDVSELRSEVRVTGRIVAALSKLAAERVTSLAPAEIERAFGGSVASKSLIRAVHSAQAVGLNIRDVYMRTPMRDAIHQVVALARSNVGRLKAEIGQNAQQRVVDVEVPEKEHCITGFDRYYTDGKGVRPAFYEIDRVLKMAITEHARISGGGPGFEFRLSDIAGVPEPIAAMEDACDLFAVILLPSLQDLQRFPKDIGDILHVHRLNLPRPGRPNDTALYYGDTSTGWAYLTSKGGDLLHAYARENSHAVRSFFFREVSRYDAEGSHSQVEAWRSLARVVGVGYLADNDDVPEAAMSAPEPVALAH